MLEDMIAELLGALNAKNDILIDRAIREMKMVGLTMEEIAELLECFLQV